MNNNDGDSNMNKYDGDINDDVAITTKKIF